MEPQQPDRSRFVELNRVRLRLWEWGDEAAPPVICVHGAYDHGRMWDGLGPHLAALGFRVVAPDLRGHGDSSRLGSGHVWGATALDLALLARSLGPPVGLVGHSFGGGQALFVAGVWPELVRWVVNIDGIGPPPEAFAERDLKQSAAEGVSAAERVLFGLPRAYASLEEMVDRRARINQRLPRAWLEHLVRHGARAADAGFVWKADPMFSVGFAGEFSMDHFHAEQELVRCPVLVLTGAERDTWSELDEAQTQDRLSRLAHARHEVVPGAGHYVHIERPDLVLDAVRSFVATVAA